MYHRNGVIFEHEYQFILAMPRNLNSEKIELVCDKRL